MSGSSSPSSWSSERLTPRQFVERYSLPRLARLAAGAGGDIPAQPLLLYCQYRSGKVQARCLAPRPSKAPASTGSTHSWQHVGPGVVIPDTYSGWFSLLCERGQPTAPCYLSLDQLVAARVTFFLPTSDLPAYRLAEAKDTKGRSVYTKVAARAGRVLQLLGVFEDQAARRLAGRLSSLPLLGRGSPGVVLQSPVTSSMGAVAAACSGTKYAQCLNHHGEVVFIPLTASGRFYAVAPRGEGRSGTPHRHQVASLQQLLRAHRLPLTVRLVCGVLPSGPCGFTGTLLLERHQRQDVVLASTLGGRGEAPALLELELDSRLALSRALDECRAAATMLPAYRAALALCRDHGDVWRRRIKVTRHVLKRRSANGHSHGHESDGGSSGSGGDLGELHTISPNPPPLPPRGERPLSLSLLHVSTDVPYARVLDAREPDDEDRDPVYAEICENGAVSTSTDYSYMRLGGSDGTFSGTMSSSSPEDSGSIYDSVC